MKELLVSVKLYIEDGEGKKRKETILVRMEKFNWKSLCISKNGMDGG